MIKILLFILITGIFISSCEREIIVNNEKIIYNIIEPGNGIYNIIDRNISKEFLVDKSYEEIFSVNNLILEIRRYNKSNELTDQFSVAAITKFEHDFYNRIKVLRYYDKNNQPSEDEVFGYSSIEYIYDEENRVRMEIYRDKNDKFLDIPVDNSGNIAKVNFISPVLTYEYIGDQLKIKALDKNFNLLKEIVGDKPCIPFIDCGESD